MDSKETTEKKQAEGHTDDPGGEEGGRRAVIPASEQSNEPGILNEETGANEHTEGRSVELRIEKGVKQEGSQTSEKPKESPVRRFDPSMPTTSGSRRSPSPLPTSKSSPFIGVGKSLANYVTSVGSKLWQRKLSDAPVSNQGKPPDAEATRQVDSGQAVRINIYWLV